MMENFPVRVSYYFRITSAYEYRLSYVFNQKIAYELMLYYCDLKYTVDEWLRSVPWDSSKIVKKSTIIWEMFKNLSNELKLVHAGNLISPIGARHPCSKKTQHVFSKIPAVTSRDIYGNAPVGISWNRPGTRNRRLPIVCQTKCSSSGPRPHRVDDRGRGVRPCTAAAAGNSRCHRGPGYRINIWRVT